MRATMPYKIFTTHKRSLGQGNIFAPVYHSVHGGVPGQVPPGRYTPLDKYPWQVHPQQVHPLAGNTPRQVHPGRYTPLAGTPQQCMLGYGQQAGGTHPTGMHCCCIIFFVFGKI